jgi:hypothetical protein
MASQFDRDLYTLRSAGFAIIPDYLPGDRLDELGAEAWKFRAEIEEFEKSGGQVAYKAGWPLLNARCLYAFSEPFQRLILDERLAAYTRAYLETPQLLDCHLLCNMPDERNQARGRQAEVNFHRDAMWPEGEIRPTYLHTFLLLTEMTSANGGTILVPGTHRQREPDYYFKDTDPGARIEENFYPVYPRRYFPASIQVEAPRGSLVLIDPMAIHAQGINVTTEVRQVLNCSFIRAGTRGLFDCRGLAQKHARYPISAPLLEVLHEDSSLPQHYGPLASG